MESGLIQNDAGESIRTARLTAKGGGGRASFPAQIESVVLKEAANGKAYRELKVRDARDSMVLRAWPESQSFEICGRLPQGGAIRIEGDFFEHSTFGPDARNWTLRPLTEDEAEIFFSGDEEWRREVERAYGAVGDIVASIGDPRLHALCRMFLETHGERFKRAAAARNFHHAFRGGLLMHTAQMLRAADAVAGAYPRLNRSLLLAGTLFHDAGKLWETCPPERGFEIKSTPVGDMLGHIVIGVELINKFWQALDVTQWAAIEPGSENVRLHLLHLVAAHHGTHEFGSPVLPKTPEAIALHMIDNLDAKLEMIFESYAAAGVPGAPLERSRALGVVPVPALADVRQPIDCSTNPPEPTPNES